MDRSPTAEGGFRSRLALATSSCLTSAVVASLALASLSLGVIEVLTVAAARSAAMPLPL